MEKGFHYGYLIVLTLALLCFGPVSFCMSCVGIFIPPIAEHIGAAPATLGYYISLLSIAGFVSLPFLGPLFEKVDSRIILSGSVVLIAIALVLQSAVTEVWQFLACGCIAGLGMSPLMFLAPSVLVNRWFAKRNGFFIGLIMCFTGIGGVVWNAVGGVLIGAVGYQATYLVFATVTLVMSLPFTLFVIRDNPSDKGLAPYGSSDVHVMDAPSAQEGVAAKEARKMPSFILLLIYAFLINLGMYTYSMLPSYVATMPESATMPMLGAVLASVTMAAQTIAKLVWGAIGEKRPVFFTVAGCLVGLAGVLVMYAFGSVIVLLFAGVVMYGFYYALTNVMNPIVTRSFFGDRDYAIIYSRVTTVATLGMVSGSLILGTAINAFGGFGVMFIGTGIFLVLSAAVILLAGRSRRREARVHEDEARTSSNVQGAGI